jgi:hypothetical protein
MKIIKFLITAISALALAGHAAAWSTNHANSSSVDPVVKSARKKSHSKIILTHGDIRHGRYKLIGDVTVTVNKAALFDPDPTPQKVAAKLRAKAAEMGADAVIFVRYRRIGWDPVAWELQGKGRAVKFKK